MVFGFEIVSILSLSRAGDIWFVWCECNSERNVRYKKIQGVFQSRTAHIVLFSWMMVHRSGQLVMGVIRICFQPVFLNNAQPVKEKGKWVRYWLHAFRKKTEEEIKWSAKEEKA